MGIQQFGGNWTEAKLLILRKYLHAYTTILTKYFSDVSYIDAFAGTGYVEKKDRLYDHELEFSLFEEDDPSPFIEGSAHIALKTTPGFNRYLFIEKDPEKVKELGRIREKFPEKSDKIVTYQGDANEKVCEICKKRLYGQRALMFLDPWGMQVDWTTIQTVAETQQIDLWILFPLGIGVSRLLRNDAQITKGARERLDRFFGTKEWYSEFYMESQEVDLFGEGDASFQKVADFGKISKFWINRLKTVFPGVLTKTCYLHNSKKNPIFLLSFACGNVQGSKTAVKIAREIVEKL